MKIISLFILLFSLAFSSNEEFINKLNLLYDKNVIEVKNDYLILKDVNHNEYNKVFRKYGLYKVKDADLSLEIEKRVKAIPKEIFIAQACLESSYGKSRFFKEGNNIFGMRIKNSSNEYIKAFGSKAARCCRYKNSQ